MTRNRVPISTVFRDLSPSGIADSTVCCLKPTNEAIEVSGAGVNDFIPSAEIGCVQMAVNVV